VYLHYALDLWFQKVVVPHCSGEVCLIRYADDFICAFEKQVDAQRFYEALGKRLGKFGLELSAEKTRIIPFSATIAPGKTSFDFLGFEFRWGKDRAGKPHVKRRTARKSLSKSLKSFNLWCKENRHLRLPVLFKQLNAKLRGYYNYYGVHGNFEPATVLLSSRPAADETPEPTQPAEKLQLGWFPATDRAVWDRETTYRRTPQSNCKDECSTWNGMKPFAEASTSEEPGTENLYAGFRAGAVG
jgi:hypothetical protein